MISRTIDNSVNEKKMYSLIDTTTNEVTMHVPSLIWLKKLNKLIPYSKIEEAEFLENLRYWVSTNEKDFQAMFETKDFAEKYSKEVLGRKNSDIFDFYKKRIQTNMLKSSN